MSSLPKCVLGVYDAESIRIAFDDCYRWKYFYRQRGSAKKQILNKIKTIDILIDLIGLLNSGLLTDKQKSLISTNWKGGYKQFKRDNIAHNDIALKMRFIKKTLLKFV